MQYTGHFTITKKDNLDFNFLLMKKRLILSSALVFVIIVAVVTLIRYQYYFMFVESLLQGLLMGVIGLVLMFGINVGSMYSRLNAMYKKRQITDFSFDVTVDESGFHAASERGNSDIPWARILQAKETGRAFYIFITENNANVLPKAQMQLPADADALRAIIKAYLEPGKCKLKKA